MREIGRELKEDITISLKSDHTFLKVVRNPPAFRRELAVHSETGVWKMYGSYISIQSCVEGKPTGGWLMCTLTDHNKRLVGHVGGFDFLTVVFRRQTASLRPAGPLL